MRTFNSKEKEILKKMMAHPMLFKQGVLRPSVFLDSHYVGPNHKISLFFKSSENLVMLSFPKEGNESNEALLFIMVFFLLLRDLEKEGLLSCTGDSTDLNASIGSQYTEGNNVKLSADIAPIVCKYFDNILIISEDLKEIVKNNFKSKDEQRYREMRSVAVGALIISVLLGLWGVCKDIILN